MPRSFHIFLFNNVSGHRETINLYRRIGRKASVSLNMSQSNVALLDLPDEILLIILKKLHNLDVLYSVLGVGNRRLDTIVQGNDFTSSLNFVKTTIAEDIASSDYTKLERFCRDIMPEICHNVKSLILDSESNVEIIMAADYPNLTELTLFDIKNEMALEFFYR